MFFKCTFVQRDFLLFLPIFVVGLNKNLKYKCDFNYEKYKIYDEPVSRFISQNLVEIHVDYMKMNV